MKLAIYVMHVPGEPSREKALETLEARIKPAPGDVYHVALDPDREGAWPTAERCWIAGLASGADWIVVLNDDALPCEDFVEVARKALAVRDRSDPVCFYTAHPKAGDVGDGWYTTHDDLVGVGCALSAKAARQFLAWVDDNPGVDDFSDDGRLNLWAMATGRRIYTTVPSLVDHQLPNESTVTWSSPDARRAVVEPLGLADLQAMPWDRPAVHLGRKRAGNHWEMLFRLRDVRAEHIERAYLAERHGQPVSRKPHVFIAMPAARSPELAVRVSVQRTIADLEKRGMAVTLLETPGDSLVTRGRHCLCHEFLRSTATHFLQWDDDVECLDHTAVRQMVLSGRDVVGGAYPWRDGSGRVVANPLRESVQASEVDIDPSARVIKVAEVGTGFLMVTRQALVDLCARHSELLYQADIEPYVGAPMWALFDAALEYRPETGRQRYASEDWRFCSLAREAGYDVHVYYPPVFRHWGKHAHEGNIATAWGMRGSVRVVEAKEAAE